jgi:PAS domain-containing protein
LPAVPPFPDAVFFTADLGEIDGLPGLEQLRRHLPDTPLLAVARVRSLAQAVDLFRRGVADYLSLPLDLAEVQERLAVAITTANSQLAAVTVEFEALDADPGDWRLSLSQVEESPAAPPLAGEAGEEAEPVEETQPVEAGEPVEEKEPGEAARPVEEAEPGEAGEEEEAGETVEKTQPVEPVEAVDSLPVSSLWDELPTGLLVFDAAGSLAYVNRLGLELFGFASLGELRQRLESGLASFAARGPNRKPLPDNHWPHVLAIRSRAERHGLVYLERPSGRRVWLRLDCLPHLHAGVVTRTSVTVVNLTGELPPDRMD